MTALLRAALAFAVLATPLRADEPPPAIASAVDAAFRPLMAQHDVPGMAVAVTVAGRSHVFAYGVASRASGAPVTADTLFELGSVSKAFTATFATYAAAQGRLALDDHPSKHMPELRGAPIDRATLVELGAYAAGGLPLQFPDSVADEAAMVAYFRRWEPSARPGETRRYSNPSFGLLGHIAARASGGGFADLAPRELFPKLGLRSTYVRVPAAAMPAYAWGYDAAGKAVRVNPGMFDAEAYGVKSTAADMIRFVEANLRPETLEPALRRAVEGTQVGYFEVGGLVQGLGWEQFPYPVARDRLLAGNAPAMILDANPATRLAPPRVAAAPTLFDKTGSTNGFGAYVAFVPRERIGVVMLANRSLPIPARVAAAHAVLEAL